MPFRFQPLSIPDVVLIEAKLIEDGRGFFQEIFKTSDFKAHGVPSSFVQDNHSRSHKGTLRGLHYQLAPQAQGKLVTVTTGCIFAVAVDIRRCSPSYGRWVGQELSDRNGYQLYVPTGFAHGFCVLGETADVLYKVTAEYAHKMGRGIIWDDPAIGIKWPIANPKLSDRDSNLPLLHSAENNF